MGRASRSARGDDRRRRRTKIPAAVKWGGALALFALLIYGLSITAGVPYDENDIRAVDFSRLESGENLHMVWSSRPLVRASRWLRRLLVDLFWVM